MSEVTVQRLLARVDGQMDKLVRRIPCRPLKLLKQIDPEEADAYLQGYYNLSENARILRLR